jgi:hypothetical protein
VDTSNWIGGRTVLIAPARAHHIDWLHRQIQVAVTRQVVRDGPEYDPATVIDAQYEARLAELSPRPGRRSGGATGFG